MEHTYDLIGPPLGSQCNPTVLYFALSKKESLFADPYNQPVLPWQQQHLRVISFDLPSHGEGQISQQGINGWAKAFENHLDPLTPFLDQVEQFIHSHLKEELKNGKLGFAGLSRGCFLALTLSQRFQDSLPIVSFSPLLALERVKEFSSLPKKHFEHFNLIEQIEKLLHHRFFFTIGNNDRRVHTEETLSLVTELLLRMKHHSQGKIPVELHLYPSIGMYGHGTPQTMFLEGSRWLIEQLQ